MIACEASTWPIGEASGGEPVSARIRSSSSSTSSSRSPAPSARSECVDPADDARRQVVLRREHGDARHERRHELVADVLVDEVGRLPERVDVDAGIEPDAGERLGERLARDAVERRARADRSRRR